MEVVKYIGGCSVHRGIASILWWIASVLWRLFSTVGDSFNTFGGYLQYCGVCSVQWGDNISTIGDSFSTVGDNISTVEGIQYSGGRILISACLVSNNDEKISTFFVLQYESFIWKFYENSSRFHAF